MLCKVAQFTKQSATGNQAVTGVGFEPKVVILHANSATAANSFGADSVFFWGFAASTVASAQKSLSIYGIDDADPSEVNSGFHSGAIFNDTRAGTFTQLATLVSFDADGFTLNWSVNTTPNYIITYMALAGEDLSQAKVGQFTAPSTTGHSSTTGVGFQPDLLMLLGTGHDADDSASATQGTYSYGFARAPTERAVLSGIIEAGQDTTETANYHRDDMVLAMFSATDATTLTHEANVASMDSDGFTLDYSTASAANKRVVYLALQGGRYRISSIGSPKIGAPPLSQSNTELGYPPKGMIFLTAGQAMPLPETIQAHCRLSIGITDSTPNRSCHWTGDENGATAQTAVSIVNDNQIIRVSDETPTVTDTTTQALADITSLDSNGFTLSWSVKDLANSYHVTFIVFADHAPSEEREQLFVSFAEPNLAQSTGRHSRHLHTRI